MRPSCLVPAAILLGGCTGSGEADRSATVTVDTLPGGTVRVTNAGPTAWTGLDGWQLVLEQTIAPDEESAGMLSRPWSLASDEAGNVYVMDMRPNLVKVFRPDGSLSHTIGREGDGPGEYRPGAILHLTGDTLLVHDPTNARVVRFHVDGTPLGEWPAGDSRLGARPVRHDGTIPVRLVMRDREVNTATHFAPAGYRYHRPDGTLLDTVRIPPEPKPKMWELRDAQNDFGTFVPFAPWQEHVLTPSGTVVWGSTEHYRLVVSRHGEDTAIVFTAPESPVAIPDSVRRRSFDEAVTRESWIAERGSLADIPSHHTPWTSIAADRTDHIWVQRNDRTGLVADVFSPDGVLLGTVATPFEFHPRDHWTADRIYHPDTDEEGLPVIRVYRIERPAR